MDELRMWAGRWGDLANVIGLLATVLGFLITIIGVWRSKSAAESARKAALAAKETLIRYTAVADLASAIAIMGEIKRHQRHGSWAVLPDRYSELRRCLIVIKSSDIQLTEPQHQTLQLAIETFANLERKVERAALSNGSPPNPAKLNDIVSGQIDEVHTVLVSFQQSLRLEK